MAVPQPPLPPPGAGGNRTDLLTPGTPPPAPGSGQPNGQPIQVPTGTPYGEAQQLQQAQQAVPLAKAPVVPGPGNPPTAGGGLDIASAMSAAKNFQKPNIGKLTRGTERPNEAVTAGLPGGMVPQQQPQRQVGNLSSMIAAVAQASGSASLSRLAARAASIGQ